MDRLHLLPTHSLFGRFSDDPVDDLNDPDSVDGAFSAALRRMEEEWFPHGSRTMFMLDLLDNLPRLRLSDDHLKAIIWVMRECKTPNVPSFSALRKKQASMTSEVGIKSEHHTSHWDWGNPLVRPFIHIYPELSGPIAEFWQAGKWTSEIELDELSPMWADWRNKTTSHRHFFVNELAQQHDETYVVPVRWVTIDDVVHADVHDVDIVRNEEVKFLTVYGDLFDIKTGHYRRIPAATLASNFLDLRASLPSIKFTDYSPAYEMPHPLREKGQGRPMFRDDVSGNVSKQYNAHTNMYVTNLNLPHQKLAQEYFVRFASTSPHASSSEQFVALGEDFVPGTWHEAYDCELEQEILFEIIPHLLPADNPQQSETASHIGMGGNLGCRRDLNGGTKEQQESDEGYRAFIVYVFSPHIPRTKEVTIQIIRWQVWNACAGNNKALDTSYSQTGIKDKISQYWIQKVLDMGKERRAAALSDPKTRNPQLNLSSLKGEARKTLKDEISRTIQLDLWNWVALTLTGDTPAEILHTYLLGNDKYVWHDTTKQWDDKKEEIFAARLAASSITGLSIPPPRARYVVQYKNSLIVFHLHDLCTPLLFDLWKATGELGAHLWFPEIKTWSNTWYEKRILIANVLDIWGLIDPERILVKGKLHVFAHLPEDILRFGPSILYATEIYECWNAIFRLCSIFSNHLSPSRDIAATLADMERFKHIVSGGWWRNSEGLYIRAGSRVRSFLTSNKELQRRLGWSQKSLLDSGTVKLEPSTKRSSSSWATMNSDLLLTEPMPVESFWVLCKSVVAQSGDACKNGSWIFFQTLETESPQAGRISKIVARERDGKPLTQHENVVVVVDLFLDIMFEFNVQHDCVTCGCSTAAVPVLQERILTDRTELQTKHSSEPRFILNMHDRVASHNRFAEQLRVTGPAKRAATKAKTQATRARNRQHKITTASAQAKRQEDERNNQESGNEMDENDEGMMDWD
ncbi:hypothetical protein B0H13DRAFT_2239608 [Mycena leptocephala]|nr:hypothetical protein B0H13DRAFT_2239608 [Mycena leptocephala]